MFNIFLFIFVFVAAILFFMWLVDAHVSMARVDPLKSLQAGSKVTLEDVAVQSAQSAMFLLSV